eukprot:g2557.t1
MTILGDGIPSEFLLESCEGSSDETVRMCASPNKVHFAVVTMLGARYRLSVWKAAPHKTMTCIATTRGELPDAKQVLVGALWSSGEDDDKDSIMIITSGCIGCYRFRSSANDDAGDLQERFKIAAEEKILCASSCVANGTGDGNSFFVLSTCAGSLLAMRVRDGSVLWKKKNSVSKRHCIELSDRVVHAVSDGASAYLLGFVLSDGSSCVCSLRVESDNVSKTDEGVIQRSSAVAISLVSDLRSGNVRAELHVRAAVGCRSGAVNVYRRHTVVSGSSEGSDAKGD